jgi:hypothetical protein
LIIETQRKFPNTNWLLASLTTSFERNLLPPFAEWIAELIGAEQPKLLMPVETKGARLLDAALCWLERNERPPRLPVRLRRALDYTDPAELAGATILVVDDTTRTGRTLNRYRKRIQDCTPEATALLVACFGVLAEDGSPRSRVRDEIRCFRECLPSQYRENVWQLAEFLASFGLPPEVDHHVLRLPTTIPLARQWELVIDRLRPFGVVDDYGVVSADGLLYGATLHWPSFAPRQLLAASGPIRREGVVKVRLFGDVSRDELIVIPLAFLEIDVARLKRRPVVTRDEARSLIASWRGAASTVGDVLLENALPNARFSEVLFDASSLTIEVELVRGFVGALDDLVEGSQLSFDEAHFHRLYGPVAPMLMKGIANAIAEPREEDAVTTGSASDAMNATEPAKSVKQATDCLVRVLKRGYKNRNVGRAESDWRPYRLSFSELLRLEECPASTDATTLSRCLDLGLAIGSLVPATTAEPKGDKMVLRRRYRTSEQADVDDDGNVVDLQAYKEEVAGEAIAATALILSRRTHRWRDTALAPFAMNKILAILRAAMPEMAQTAIAVAPGEHGPEAFVEVSRVAAPDVHVRLMNTTSAHFRVTGETRIEPTPGFLERYKAGDLIIRRRRLLPQLEAYLTSLAPALDAVGDVSALLVPWAMSTSGRLGLDFAMHDVDAALGELDRPVEILRGGLPLDRARLEATLTRARRLLGVARSGKLAPLRTDWSAQIRDFWEQPLTIEQDLLSTLHAKGPIEPLIFDVAAAFCSALEHYCDALASLDAFAARDPQVALFGEEQIGPEDVALTLVRLVRRLRTVLRTMRRPTDSAPSAARSRSSASLAAELHAFNIILRRYLAAFAWRQDRLGVAPPHDRERQSVILYVDFANSTVRAAEDDRQTYQAWIADGLNLVSQWAKAFGAREMPDPGRRGDDISLEFTDPDGAVLCASMFQEHFSALRSTGTRRLFYECRCAVDQDWVVDAEGGNRISPGINIAAKLAKSSEPNLISLTPEAARECSPTLQDFLEPGRDVALVGERERGRFTVKLADRHRVLSAYADRLRMEVAARDEPRD